MATKKFKCKVCGYVHEGDKAPEQCPMCQAPQSEFEEIVEEGAAPAKKGLNTNSNVYTILYAAVMVVIVAFLLVFVSQTLKERQTANVINDTKQQILSALNLRDLPDVAGTYDEVIKADALMQPDGKMAVTIEDEQGLLSYHVSYMGQTMRLLLTLIRDSGSGW